MNSPFDFQELMKKAQELQEVVKQQAEESGKVEHRITVGGDMVEVVINGKQEIQSIRIDPEIVDKEDVETLQDLMCAAFNQAIQKTRNSTMDSMGGLLNNFKFPGMPS